jgi:hypothetical protein
MALRILVALSMLPVVAGCAGLEYRDYSTLSQTRYATVESFGADPIDAETVDGLLEEVADILDVALDPTKPKVRIVVRAPFEIRTLYRRTMTIAPGGAEAQALYFAGATLVVIPRYDRTILGHELAHYLTDQYLTGTPRRKWERIAQTVEDALPATPRSVAHKSPSPATLTAQVAAVVPLVPGPISASPEKQRLRKRPVMAPTTTSEPSEDPKRVAW